jgi:hypothetical protein
MLESALVVTTETATGTFTSNSSTSSITIEASPTSHESKPSGERKGLWIGLLAGIGGGLLLAIAANFIFRRRVSRKARQQGIELTHSALPPSNTSRPPHPAT